MTRRSPYSRNLQALASHPQKITIIPIKAVKKGDFPKQTLATTELTRKAKTVKNRHRRTSKPFYSSAARSIFLYLLRLGITGVGLAAIAGTVLPLLEPVELFKRLNISLPVAETKQNQREKTTAQPLTALETSRFELTQELDYLKSKLVKVGVKYPKLHPHSFFIDVDNGNYVSINGEVAISAASTIKTPILVAFFQDVDAGKIRLDEKLTMDKTVMVGEAGKMQYSPPGTQYNALETATQMIVISDNTATNMLIRRLGGQEALNQRFREWGLSNTVINQYLPDLEGTNTTSPQDLALLLAKVTQGELVSLKSRDRLLSIMQKTENNTLLAQGIEKEAKIAHKTGNIGSVLGDGGIIDIPNGKRYIGVILVSRPHNDDTAKSLIQELSTTAYQHFKWSLPPATPSKTQEH